MNPPHPREERARSSDVFTPGRFILLQILSLAILYPGLIAGSRSMFFRDFGQYGYPNAHFLRDCFWKFDLPLWNPLSSCGIPFLAQWNTMALYPGSLLYLLAPLPWSLNLFSVVHLFLGGLGMYCLARRWTPNGLAATIAGLLYSVNGVAMNAVMWPSIVGALGLAPWVVHSTLGVAGMAPRALPAAVVLATLQMLTGGVEMVIATWLVIGVLSLDLLLKPSTRRLRLVFRLSVVVLWVSLLSAIQLLPFAGLLAGSERTETSTGSFSSMPLYGWANFVVPLFGTVRTPTGLPFQPGQIWLTSYYLGIGTVVLTLVATFLRPRRRTVLLAGAALLFLLLALGDRGGLYPAINKVLPLVGVLRYPVKFVLPVLLLAPLLVAIGLDRLQAVAGSKGRPPKSLLFAIAVVAFLILLLGAIAPLAQEQPELVASTRWSATFRLGFLALIGVAITGALAAGLGRRRLLFQLGLLILWFLDVFTHAPEQAPTVPSEVFLMRMDPHRTMSAKPLPGMGRAMLSPQALALFDRTHLADSASSYLGLRLGLYMNCNLLEQIPKVDGFFPLQPKHHARLAGRLAQTDPVPEGLADFLGVTQLTAPETVTAWRARPTALPLATGGQQPLALDDRATLDRLFDPAFNPRREMFHDPSGTPALAAARPGNPSLQVISFTTREIRITCHTEETNAVVVSQTFDPAWRAKVDGRPVPLHRANLAFQAVLVPPGDHELELSYQDHRFLIGLGLSVVSAAALPVWRLRRRRHRTHREPG